jgi:hypothetical protein
MTRLEHGIHLFVVVRLFLVLAVVAVLSTQSIDCGGLEDLPSPAFVGDR